MLVPTKITLDYPAEGHPWTPEGKISSEMIEVPAGVELEVVDYDMTERGDSTWLLLPDGTEVIIFDLWNYFAEAS